MGWFPYLKFKLKGKLVDNIKTVSLFKSTVPLGSRWNKLTNFLVSNPREVSYLVFSRGDLNNKKDSEKNH